MKMEQMGVPKPKEEIKDLVNQEKSEDLTKMKNRVVLSLEDQQLSFSDLAKKYGITERQAYRIKKRGLINVDLISNLENGNIEIQKDLKNSLDQITDINISSLETVWGNEREQEIIRDIVQKYDSGLKFNNAKRFKKFKLLNGRELTLGDLKVLLKLIDLKVSRNDEGNLMMFDNDSNRFREFNPMVFFGQNKSFSFKNTLNNYDFKENPRLKYENVSLENIAPEIFKMGIFQEKDFSKARRMAGSVLYENQGLNEKKLSKENPYAVLSNNVGGAKYFLGRNKFVGTDKIINHETVRISLIDNNTACISDIINGRKIILYTFPLINQSEYEKKEKNLMTKDYKSSKSKINSSYIIVGGAEMIKRLRPYSIYDYFPRKDGESDSEYANRISAVSDISYVLGNFRSFMSETGLAATNYNWREQLILSSTLTTIENKNKLINFSKKYQKSGLRTFLSIEQGGKEMGDKILALGESEKLSEESKREIFKGYSNLIDSADRVKNTLSRALEAEEDPILKNAPDQVYKALLLRAKDVLIGAHKIVMDDESKLNPDDVIKALEGITLMLDMLADIEKRELFVFNKTLTLDKNLFKFNVKDKNEKKYELKIFVRPVAESNAQARINFELSFDTDNPNKELQKAFYNEVNFIEKGKTVKGSKLRIGIDRDTYGDETLVSLDLGRSEHVSSKFERTGDVLGKLLVKATESNIGHHTNSFDKGLADEKVFQKLCVDFTSYLNKS